MRIAYLYDQDEKEADHMNAEKVFIDTPATRREALNNLIDMTGVRKGDIVIVTTKSKLGHGKGADRIERLIKGKGATIEISPSPLRPSNLRRKKRPPKPDDMTYLMGVWKSALGEAAALVQASQHMGFPIDRAWMNYHVCMRDGGPSTKQRNLDKKNKEAPDHG